MLTIVIDTKDIKENILYLQDLNEINHIKNVYRMKNKDKFRAVDGEKEYIFEIEIIENKKIIAKKLEEREDEYSKDTKVDIALGILKNDKMDIAIQKLTEIGINKIIPLITKRNTVKITEKKDKWDKISKEALKQCRGVKFIKITEPKSITQINYQDYSKIIVLYENEENKYLNKLDLKYSKILYIIGSEGGFENTEIEYFKSKNAEIVSLGKRILRAETAAVVVGGIILNEVD